MSRHRVPSRQTCSTSHAAMHARPPWRSLLSRAVSLSAPLPLRPRACARHTVNSAVVQGPVCAPRPAVTACSQPGWSRRCHAHRAQSQHKSSARAIGHDASARPVQRSSSVKPELEQRHAHHALCARRPLAWHEEMRPSVEKQLSRRLPTECPSRRQGGLAILNAAGRIVFDQLTRRLCTAAR